MELGKGDKPDTPIVFSGARDDIWESLATTEQSMTESIPVRRVYPPHVHHPRLAASAAWLGDAAHEPLTVSDKSGMLYPSNSFSHSWTSDESVEMLSITIALYLSMLTSRRDFILCRPRRQKICDKINQLV